MPFVLSCMKGAVFLCGTVGCQKSQIRTSDLKTCRGKGKREVLHG